MQILQISVVLSFLSVMNFPKGCRTDAPAGLPVSAVEWATLKTIEIILVRPVGTHGPGNRQSCSGFV